MGKVENISFFTFALTVFDHDHVPVRAGWCIFGALTGFVKDKSLPGPCLSVIRVIDAHSLPFIGQHPVASLEAESLGAFVAAAVNGGLVMHLPGEEVIAFGGHGHTAAAFVFVPDMPFTVRHLHQRCVYHAGRVYFDEIVEFPVPQVLGCIVSQPFDTAPVDAGTLDIGDKEMISPFEINHIRRPESVASRFDVQIQTAPIDPGAAVVIGGGDPDIASIAVGHVGSVHIGAPGGVEHPPAFFGTVPDDDRIGRAVKHRIPVEGSRSLGRFSRGGRSRLNKEKR